MTEKCFFCGETNPIVLEEHHIYPKWAEKVTENLGLPNETIVVCRNCHKKLHHILSYYKGIVEKITPEPEGRFSYGLMQILDETARGYGVTNLDKLIEDPNYNIAVACRILIDIMTKYSDPEDIFAAYHAGDVYLGPYAEKPTRPHRYCTLKYAEAIGCREGMYYVRMRDTSESRGYKAMGFDEYYNQRYVDKVMKLYNEAIKIL